MTSYQVENKFNDTIFISTTILYCSEVLTFSMLEIIKDFHFETIKWALFAVSVARNAIASSHRIIGRKTLERRPIGESHNMKRIQWEEEIISFR